MIGKKALGLIPVILAASFLTFMLLSLLPGDPVLTILGPNNVSPENIEAVRAELGLDDPLPLRYLSWLGDALTGDLGRSYQTNQEVLEGIRERLPVTIQLMVMSLTIALVISIPLGVITAYRAGSRFDKAVTAISFGLLSVPNFMLALLLIIVFAVELGWLPATGWTRLTEDPFQSIRSAILPAISLSVANVAVFTRLLRTDMISTLQDDHVMMAKAKGLPTSQILFRHALRPSSFSLMTLIGLQMAALIGGSIVVEQIFALPGLGTYLIRSIQQRDLLVVQGVVLVLAVAYVVINFVIDVLYTILDPRIRHGHARATA
ncbi:MAG TPA: ABC transporter permease [Acidimicrobiales bacterium]|nr:ABC transporter permease [Acidimicrobiales bacterium]